MILTMLHITKLHNNCIKTLLFCGALSKNIKCLLEVDPMYLKGEILPPLDKIIRIAKKLRLCIIAARKHETTASMVLISIEPH